MDSFEKWFKSTGYSYENESAVAYDAWKACKEEALKILKRDWTGADLSINSCDEHYINQIKEL